MKRKRKRARERVRKKENSHNSNNNKRQLIRPTNLLPWSVDFVSAVLGPGHGLSAPVAQSQGISEISAA